MPPRDPVLWTLLLALLPGAAPAQVLRAWLTPRSEGELIVSCQTVGREPVAVRAWRDSDVPCERRSSGDDTLHHVAIPFPDDGAALHYEIRTATGEPLRATLRPAPREELRLAVLADWGYAPRDLDLSALRRAAPHFLLTAGDNVRNHHEACGAGVLDCTRAYEALIDSQPEIFRSTPFLPILGNHDNEVRPRGPSPPAEPVYDVDATAFRRFFALPEPRWHWSIEQPRFSLRLLALNLHHVTDFGTTWQSCRAFTPDSEQQRWFAAETLRPGARYTLALQNEQNARMRALPGWGPLFARCTAVITGYGYFAERAVPEAGGLFFNTCVAPPGNLVRDPASRFLARESSFLLITVPTAGPLRVEIRSLAGEVLDRTIVAGPISPQPTR